MGPFLDASPAPTGVVDWTPRRLQRFPRAPGAHLRYSNREGAGATLVEDRVVTADAAGLVTVDGARITVSGNTLRLDAIDLSTPPRLLATGIVRPGGSLALNAFGAPGAATLLAAGTAPVSIPIPGLAGILEIGDPLVVGAGAIGGDGKLDFAFPLDPSLAASVGTTVRFQALVGPAFTNAEVVTLLP